MHRTHRFLLTVSLCLGGLGAGSAAGAVEGVHLMGRLVDGSGDPVAGAQVRLYPQAGPYDVGVGDLQGRPPEAKAGTRSDAQGRFKLQAPEPGMWVLVAGAGGDGGTLQVAYPLTPVVEPKEIETLTLASSETVEVRVHDPAGKPLPKALVLLNSHAPASPASRRRVSAYPYRRPGLTDDSGLVRLPAALNGPYRLEVTAQGYVPWRLEEGSGSPQQVVLQPGRACTLEVRSSDGSLAAGALVRVGPRNLPYALTDEGGRAGIVVPQGGDLTFEVLSRSGERVRETLHAGRVPAQLQVRLQPLAYLEGSVVGGAERVPVAGALVWPLTAPSLWTRSDREGRYRVGWRSFQSTAGATPSSARVSAAATNHFGTSAPVSVAHQREGAGPTLVLEPATVAHGVVVDGQGQSLAGVELVTLPSGLAMGSWSRTRTRSAEDGTFRLGPLRLGIELEVEARHPGFAPTRVQLVTEGGNETPELRMEMQPGIAAFGTVVDEADRPLTGVEVTLVPALEAGTSILTLYRRRFDDTDPNRAWTDGEGRFELQDLAAGKFDLSTRAPGYAPARVPALQVPTAARPVDLGTVVLSPGVSIEGRVTDKEGVPLEGAQVHIDEEGGFIVSRTGVEEPADAVSGHDGRFVVADLAAGQSFALRVKLPGYGPAQLPGVQAPTEEPLEVVLEPASTLRGIVVTRDGDPLAGAGVALSAEHGSTGPQGSTMRGFDRLHHRSRTDSQGRFELADIVAGRWELVATASGYQESRQSGIEVVAGQDAQELRVVLIEGATVSGRVLGPGGAPVVGASVRLVDKNRRFGTMGMGHSARSDGDGTYRITGLPTATVSLAAEHRDHRTLVRDVEARPGENVLDFQLERGLEISGRVVDTGGSPVVGARVQASAAMRGTSTLSGADGSFTLAGLADGSYQLSARKDGYATTAPESVRIDGQSAFGMELRLERGAVVSGWIRGLDFDDLAQVQMMAVSTDGSSRPVLGQVDYEGKYRLQNLAPGAWRVMATLGRSGHRVQEPITLDPGVTEVRLDLEFGGGWSLRGQVVAPHGPVSGIQIYAGGGKSNATGITDHQGRFELAGLETGTYRIGVMGDTGSLHQEEIELTGDQEILIELKEASILGRVTDELDGTPLPDAEVVLLAIRGAVSAAGFAPMPRSDEEGRFRLARILPGRYRLQVSKEGYATGSVEVEVEETQDAEVEVRLSPSQGLLLHVLHAGGTPALEAELAALDAAGRPVLTGSYNTGEGGRIRLWELPAGSWTLLATTRGGATARQRVTAPGRPVTLRLPPAGDLTIHVPELAATGRPARLTLRDPQGRPYQALAYGTLRDSWGLVEGKATIPQLPAGPWRLEITTGERSWTPTATVVAGRSTDVFVE